MRRNLSITRYQLLNGLDTSTNLNTDKIILALQSDYSSYGSGFSTNVQSKFYYNNSSSNGSNSNSPLTLFSSHSKLIQLPLVYTELYTYIRKYKCVRCEKKKTKSQPAICLLCGCICCIEPDRNNRKCYRQDENHASRLKGKF
jgi:hypothetical protein